MEERVTPGQIGMRYGLIYALVSTVINLIPVLTETAVSTGFIMIFVNIALAFVFFILAGREFKKQNGGMISFGEGFKINMIAASLTAVIRAGIIYVYVKFIDSGYSERIMRVMEETWQQQGLNEEQIEQAKRFSGGATNPEWGLIGGLFVIILGGLIWGAISAAITKTEEDEF